MTKAILVIQELYPEQIEDLKEKAPEYQIIQSSDEVDIKVIEIILGWSEEARKIIENEESNVKWVQFPYAGVNYLPLEIMAKKGIILTNGSGIHAHSVTEQAMGLLLGMTRHIVASGRLQTQAEWYEPKSLYELSGKTMVIVGAGNIGVQLGRVAQAFDMKTIGINRSGRKIENVDEQYLQSELTNMIDKADIVVNILPLTDETEHFYDKELFDQMKDGVVFVNVGRGESVVTADLIAALDSGKIRSAGLDVFEEEPLPADSELWAREDVLMTPHIAGTLESYPKHIYPLFMENFEAFKKGEPLPRNIVELEEGY